MTTTLLEIGGMASVALGAFLIFVPAGFIALGLGLLALGYLLED